MLVSCVSVSTGPSDVYRPLRGGYRALKDDHKRLGGCPRGAFVHSALKDAYKLLGYLWGPQMSLEFGCL